MISNAVTNMPASSGGVRSGHSGRASGETGDAFRDALDKSAKTEADAPGKEAESADAGARTAIGHTRWHSALGDMPEEQSVDGEAEASGEKLPKDVKSQMKDAVSDAVGKHLLHDGANQSAGKKTQDQAENAEAGEAAVQTAGVAAKAASSSAAAGLARAGEVASENARLPGQRTATDAQPATAADVAGDTAEEGADIPAGKRPENVQMAKSEPGIRNAPSTATAAGKGMDQTAAVSSRPDPQTGPIAGTHAAQDQRTGSDTRVSGDMQAGTSRFAGDAAKAAAKPSNEPAGVAVKSAAQGDVLAGNADAPVSRQVADAVARELEELAPSRLSLAGSTALGGRTVKTMRLQLNPAELGVVNIRMQSVDGELRVTIQADSEKTTRMLHNDSDAIRSALRAVGLGGADVVVTGGRHDPAQPQNFGAQHRDPSGQQPGAQENRQNASNESRQSYRESSSNDSANSQARGSDAGDYGNGRGSRITI